MTDLHLWLSICGVGTVWDESTETCIEDNPNGACDLVYDGNGDGVVGAGDLLGLLTEYDLSAHQKQLSLVATLSATKAMITRLCRLVSSAGLLRTSGRTSTTMGRAFSMGLTLTSGGLLKQVRARLSLRTR